MKIANPYFFCFVLASTVFCSACDPGLIPNQDTSTDNSTHEEINTTCPPLGMDLPITQVIQPAGSMWCWAACGKMYMDYVNTLERGTNAPIAMCAEVNGAISGISTVNCCARCDVCPVEGPCIIPGWPPFEQYGYTPVIQSCIPLSYDQIKYEIDCNHKPVAFSWIAAGSSCDGGDGTGHMMLIIGYSESGGLPLLDVNDPDTRPTGFKQCTYNEYVNGFAVNYSHWRDYYNVVKTPAP